MKYNEHILAAVQGTTILIIMIIMIIMIILMIIISIRSLTISYIIINIT